MWKPILDGEIQKEAIRIIKEVAEEVRDPKKEWATSEDATLAGGFSGLALFYAYLQGAFPEEGFESTAIEYLEKAVEISTSRQLYPGLYAGTSGVTWTIHHLGADESDEEGGDPLAKIDAALLQYTGKTPWKDDYDVVSGLVGIGVYALEALPKPRAKTLLEQIIMRLSEKAEEKEGGVAWKTEPELLPPWQRELAPKGYYNLGLAHGIPGIWAILAQAAAEGIQTDLATSLLEKSISWFLRQFIEKEESFPSWVVVEGTSDRGSRYAWCYGEPGIAISLFSSARFLGRSDWEEKALSIMRRVAKAPPERAGVKDAGICHGSAGLAHILNRFFQATEEELFRTAAEHWYKKTVEFQEPGKGIAGFRFMDEEKVEHSDPGLLTGSAGISLALLSAAFPIEPLWDRFLLTSIPDSE